MKQNITFHYCVDEGAEYKNIIDSKEFLVNMQEIPNSRVYIDYRLALEGIVAFENLVSQNVKAEITIINLHNEILGRYKSIFEFIAKGGNLVYHYGGIVKKHKPATKKRLAYIKELLSDIKHRWHGCIIQGTHSYVEEEEICSLIFDERERLELFITARIGMPPPINY